MNICSVYNYQGLSPNCVAMLKKVKAVTMTDKGTSMSKVNWIGLAGNKSLVAAAAGATGILLDFSRGYERTSDDPEVTTSNLGFKEKTMNQLPSIRGYATVSMCDYKTLFAADGKIFDFQLLLNDGMKMGTNQSDGTVKGFRGRIYFRFDAPNQDNAQQSYPVDIFFDDYTEFEDFYVDRADFKVSELKDAIPVGVDLSLNTAYTTGDVLVNGKKRCSNEVYSGFATTSEWSVLESNAADVTVTTVAVANGVYTLTIKKDSSGTPANLASGEYAIIQGSVDDSTYLTYVSSIFKVEVS